MTVTVLAGDHIVSADTIPSLKRELRTLGSGVSRTAYDLGNGTVLKVGSADGWAGGNRTEVECWEALRDSDIGQYLSPIIAHDSESFAWLIMRKVDGILADDSRARSEWYDSGISWELERAGINDLHDGNVGYCYDEDSDSYSFFVIDYAMSGSEDDHCGTCCARENNGCSWHSWQGRSDACCGTARFQSHDCSFLKGCNQEWCDAPGCNEWADRKVRTLWHLEQGWHTHKMVWTQDVAIVCAVHAPRNMEQINWERERLHFQLALPLNCKGSMAYYVYGDGAPKPLFAN